jgi:hypothetical protein
VIILILKLAVLLIAAGLLVLCVWALVIGVRQAIGAVRYKMLPERDKREVEFDKLLEWHERDRVEREKK